MCTLFQESGVDLLTLKGDVPTDYARALMNHLFSVEEMACSKYFAKKSSKPPLDARKRKLLEGTLYYRIYICAPSVVCS